MHVRSPALDTSSRGDFIVLSRAAGNARQGRASTRSPCRVVSRPGKQTGRGGGEKTKRKKIRQRQKLENDTISCCSRCVGAAEPLRRKIPRRSLRSRAIGIARTHAHTYARVREKKKGKENPVRTALRDGTGKVRACRTRACKAVAEKWNFHRENQVSRGVNERPCTPLASR